MNTLVAFCKKLNLGKIVAVFAAGCVLFLNVACSSGNSAGARPNNPPVQMGGQNNPHKAGGDGYNDYQMSTDPAVRKGNRASIPSTNQLIAIAGNTANQSSSNKASQDTNVTLENSRDAMKGVQAVPEQPQAVIDRSDPDVKILEKVGETFKEASKHLTGSTEESIEQSGVTRVN